MHEMEDRKIFASLMHLSLKDNWSSLPAGDLALRVGKYFLNTPYGTSTLETQDTERIVVNLRQLDCITLIENVVALTRLIKEKGTNFETFAATLQKVRYRGGDMQGYSSRLHYFSDWFYDNQLKGFVFDITEDIGGIPYKKTVNFMTKHPKQYPCLATGSQFEEMLQIEKDLSRRTFHRIPKKDLPQCADLIKDGNLLAITAAKAGLDVLHTALAIRIDGQLRLLHASQEKGQVVISEQTLSEYLEEKKERTGIIAGRIL
ncbi:MAG: DUF1460 domain-containing protein [Deltaproteobacteria bacterium]|nr:DUF1460 domain-containing protein [Deltaproteobacteria bacterium]